MYNGLSHQFFCRTYYKDAQRLYYTLNSIKKFARDFDGTIVCCPPASYDVISDVASLFSEVSVVRCNTSERDFIAQQVTKLTAHQYCTSDVIVHIDSDCVLNTTLKPKDLYHKGKISLYHTPYDVFYKNNDNCPWQPVTSYLMRFQVNLEFMRLFPLTYPRQMYVDLGVWFKHRHGIDIEQIESVVVGDLLSEFNLMGAFSFHSGRDYHSHLSTLDFPPRSFVRQMCLFNSREDRSVGPDDLAYLRRLLAAP